MNQGNISLSAGITDVFGDLNNNTGSAASGIAISGNAQVTFWDDVTNTSGLFKVNSGSTATFFGTFSGNGISGNANDIHFESDISPGFSPASITLGGNVTFGAAARFIAELGGTKPGFGYDQIASDRQFVARRSAARKSDQWLHALGGPIVQHFAVRPGSVERHVLVAAVSDLGLCARLGFLAALHRWNSIGHPDLSAGRLESRRASDRSRHPSDAHGAD